MEGTIIILILLGFTLTSKCQSMFSVIHLNEERDVRDGTPKSIKEFKVFHNTDGIETKRELTEYGQSGLPISKTFFDEDGNITSRVDLKYDTIKRIILESKTTEINVRFPTNKVGTIYRYEVDHSPTKIQYLNSNGEILSEVMLKNNSSGFPVELKLFEPHENLIGTEISSYVPEENKAIVSVVNNSGEILSIDTIKISFKDAYKFRDPNIKYNEKGDATHSQSRWHSGRIHYREYEYTYDERGNWTIQKTFEVTYKSNGKRKKELKSHFKREIVYWEK